MIGFLALFGVSVQTAVVYISYANELRLDGFSIALISIFLMPVLYAVSAREGDHLEV